MQPKSFLPENQSLSSPEAPIAAQESIDIERGQALQVETRTEARKLQTAHDLRDLQDIAVTLTPEKIPELAASVQNEIETLDIKTLPAAQDKERIEKYEQFQVGSALLLLKISKTLPSLSLDNPEQLFSGLDVGTLGLSPLESSIYLKLYAVWKAKTTSPEVWNNMFGEWKEAVTSIRSVAQKTPQKKVQQAASPEKTKDTKSETPPNSFTDMLTKAVQDPKVLATGCVVLGGILLWKLFKNNNNGGGFFSFGGLTKLLMGGAAVAGAGALLSGNMDKVGEFFKGIQSWFSGKPKENASSPDENEISDGVKYRPIKEVWKNYATDLKAPITNLEVAARANDATLLAILAKVASLAGFHNIISTGAGLSLSTAVTLAKTPFALAHGAHPGMLLLLPFIAAGGVNTINEIGEIKVPKDRENLIKHLRKEYGTYASNNPQLELPQTVDNATLEAMADIMLGEKRLGDYFKDAGKMIQDLPKNVISKVASTPEKLVGERNAYNMDTWKKHLSQFESDPEKKDAYLTLQNEIGAVTTILKNGGKLTRSHLENIAQIITGSELPMSMVLEGDFISVRVPRELGSKETKVFNIAINPDLPVKKQHELLKSFVLEPESNIFARGSQAYLQAAWNGMRSRLPDFNKKENAGAENELGGEMAKGNAVMIMVGEAAYFYFKSVGEYFTVPFSLVGKLPKLVTGNLSAEEFTGTLGWSLFPGMIVGATKEVVAMMKEGPSYFKNGHLLGKVIQNIGIRGALAPVTATVDIINIGRKSLYMYDVVRDHGLSELLIKNPKLYVTSRMNAYWTGKMATLRSEKYGVLARTLRTLPMAINTEIASKYAHLNEMNQIITKLSEAKFNTKKRIELIQAADDAMATSGRLEDLRKKFGTVNPSNFEQVLKETVLVLKDEEIRLKTMKAKSVELAKTTDPVRKQQLSAEIKQLENSTAPARPQTHAAPDAPAAAIEKKVYTSPKEALDELKLLEKKGGALAHSKEVVQRLDDIDTYLTKWSETINARTDLLPAQKQSILDKTVNSYAKRVQAVRTHVHAANVRAFDALPTSQQTPDLARQVNSVLESGDKSLTKMLIDGGRGRAKLFALEFATLLTIQKGVEIAADPLHSFENAIAGVASKETMQLVIDLLPITGFASSFSSAVTGKELITGHDTNRLMALGWGVVNLGQDAVAFLPMVGQAFRSATFMARLSELVKVGKLSPEFLAAMKTFPDLVAKHGPEAWKSLFRGLQNTGGMKKAVGMGALAMTGITVGDMVIKMGAPKEVTLAVAKV